jgi:hypothetical protein
MLNVNIEQRSEIIFHFNKQYLVDNTIPMWTIKTKGQSYYVHHIDVSSGIGFSTRESPDNPTTKGSVKIKGCLSIRQNENGLIIAKIYNKGDTEE